MSLIEENKNKRARARVAPSMPELVREWCRVAVAEAEGAPHGLLEDGDWHGWGRLGTWCEGMACRGLGGSRADSVAATLATRWAHSPEARSTDWHPGALVANPQRFWVALLCYSVPA
jgi:hypothetical protein